MAQYSSGIQKFDQNRECNFRCAQERAYELERAAQIKYETLPNLEEQLIEAEAALKSQVRAMRLPHYPGLSVTSECTCRRIGSMFITSLLHCKPWEQVLSHAATLGLPSIQTYLRCVHGHVLVIV